MKLINHLLQLQTSWFTASSERLQFHYFTISVWLSRSALLLGEFITACCSYGLSFSFSAPEWPFCYHGTWEDGGVFPLSIHQTPHFLFFSFFYQQHFSRCLQEAAVMVTAVAMPRWRSCLIRRSDKWRSLQETCRCCEMKEDEGPTAEERMVLPSEFVYFATLTAAFSPDVQPAAGMLGEVPPQQNRKKFCLFGAASRSALLKQER